MFVQREARRAGSNSNSVTRKDLQAPGKMNASVDKSSKAEHFRGRGAGKLVATGARLGRDHRREHQLFGGLVEGRVEVHQAEIQAER